MHTNQQTGPVYIVGAGLFGSVLAERIANVQKRQVMIFEQRAHLGGNCYSFDDQETGINCHQYGCHIFHTKNAAVYQYLTRFCTLNSYHHRVYTRAHGALYPMPINLETVNKFFHLQLTPSECAAFLQQKIAASRIESPQNLEEQAVSLIGRELYEAFIKGYTQKQWQRDPKELPAYIIKRLPFRTSYNADYFDNPPYQGLPIGGYGEVFKRMLNHPLIEVRLNTRWQEVKDKIPADAVVIYTGMPDELFDYCLGRLEWRTLDFKWETVSVGDYQGCACINEADPEVPYTRTHEFRHYHPENTRAAKDKSVICREYSREYRAGDIPFYPVDTQRNRELYSQYQEMAKRSGRFILGGRLGLYRYMDMDVTIAAALQCFAEEFLSGRH